MHRSLAAILLLWAVYGGPLCGEICAQLDAQAALAVPPCHAPPAEAPEREACCDDADVFAAAVPPSVGEPGTSALPPFAAELPNAAVGPVRVPVHPPDPLAPPFARTHRPLLT